MEVQMAVKGARSLGTSTPPHRHGGGKAVPGYLRPSAGSCHHVCKYGGAHTLEEERVAPPKPRKQPPVPDSQKMAPIKARSVSRRRVVGGSGRAEKQAAKAAAGREKEVVERAEWKDILAYDTVPARGSSPRLDKIPAQVPGSGDATKKNVMKGKESYDRAASPPDKNTDTDTDTEGLKPPKGKRLAALLVEKKAAADQEATLHGYQTLSPSLLQSRASLLRDLEKEMVRDATDAEGERATTCSLDHQEEYAAAAESSRPIPAHRRVKSMSFSSSRSVRFPNPTPTPFVRQASKNSSATFRLRSKSTKAPPILPPEEEKKPARLKSRRGAAAGEDAGGAGRGIQLRIRSLRRRGVGGAGTGFVVPAVALRHQKTLERKKSQRLYNNLIEETASKLVKTRKSRVKALVGAFETVMSKIRK